MTTAARPTPPVPTPTALSTTTSVQLVPSPLDSPLGQIIAPFRATLQPFLRHGHTLERVASELVLASRKTPHLDKCPPEALVETVCRALETGGVIGQDVYIVPFFDKKRGAYEPTLMLDYKFKGSLVVLAGGARSLDARNVYDDEHCEVRYGTNPGIDHRPVKVGKKGRRLIAAYAIAFHGMNHHPTVVCLNDQEIEAVRARSKQWGPGDFPDRPEWYGPKTCVHRVVKLLPKNPKLARVLGFFDREDADEGLFTPAVAQLSSGEVVDRATGEILEPPTPRLMPVGPDEGRPLSEFSDTHLSKVLHWCEERGGYAAAIAVLLEELEVRREGAQPGLGLEEPPRRGRNAIAEGR